MFLLGIPIEYLLVPLVGLGMALLSRPNSGGFLNGLVRIVRWIPIFGGLTAEQIVKVDQWVTHELGKATAALTSRLSAWFGALTHYQDVVGYWSLYWPIGAYHVVRHLVERVIPHQITARTAPLARRIDATEAQVKATAGAAHSFPQVAKAHDRIVPVTRIERVAMPYAGQWDWIHRHFTALEKAVTTAATGAVAGTLPHAPSFPVPWRGIRTDLGKLWKFRNYILGATGAAALVATAIGQITPNCVRNGALGKVARKLCGLNPSSLEHLLGLIVDLFVLENVCTVIPFLEQIASDVAVPIVEVLTDVGAGLCHGSIGASKPLQGPTATPPRYFYRVDLAA